MKHTPIHPDLSAFPEEFRALLRDAALFDSSSSPQAQVILIQKDEGYYLKSAPKGALATEVVLTRFFHEKRLAVPVLVYLSDQRDWMLTPRVRGCDCTDGEYLSSPGRLCDILAQVLLRLHGISPTGCPVADRTADYLGAVERNYRAGCFDPSLLPPEQRSLSPEAVRQIIARQGHLLRHDTLIHGDACLPNIMLDHWRFRALIDLGNGGAGDRHIDLFWAAWSLCFNLKTDRYTRRLFDAYGRDRIDPDRLRLVALCEAFG